MIFQLHVFHRNTVSGHMECESCGHRMVWSLHRTGAKLDQLVKVSELAAPHVQCDHCGRVAVPLMPGQCL